MDFKAWEGFNKSGEWTKEIDVRGFIRYNYTPYDGDSSFLKGATEKTKKLWNEVLELYKKEREAGGVLDADTKTPSAINAYDAGYINKELEDIVGLQTDKPLKRAIMPNGGIRIVEKSCEAYGLKVDEQTEYIYHNLRKTHNDGVFSVYTPDIRAARSSHLITGLPDGYGRGRIIGDYRRVALYGVDRLIEDKMQQKLSLEVSCMDEDTIRLSVTILSMFIIIILIATMAILWLNDFGLFDVLFMSVSAISSTGLTSTSMQVLNAAGKFILMILMFIGRIGPLSIFAIFAPESNKAKIDFPKEELIL